MEKLIVSAVIYAVVFAFLNFLLSAGFNLIDIVTFTGAYVIARFAADKICKE